MKFEENDVVRIITDCKRGIEKGEVGTILAVFDVPHEAYEVEVVDEKGYPKAQCAFSPSELELLMR